MPSILSKNCIVAGAIDFYCLLCSKPFVTEEDAIAHIGESHHKTTLNSTGYYKMYEDDRIKKIRSLYFCEWCNTTLPMEIKVKLHIGEDDHIEKKTINRITRNDGSVLVSGRIVIEEDSWNGLVDENCVICSVEIDNKVAHKSSQSHVLNLIRSEVLFGQQGTVYRKIDASSYHCLNCNIMLSQHELTQHFQTTEHTDFMTIYVKKLSIKQSVHTNNSENVIQNKPENAIPPKPENRKDDKSDHVKKEEKGALPFATGMRSNGKEKTTLFTEPVLRNGKDQATRPPSVDSADELETYAKEHGLSPNRRDESFYCKVCTRRIPATLKALKTHVNSKSHQEKASMKTCNTETRSTKPKTVPAHEFFKEVTFFEEKGLLRLIVNNKFFVHPTSFNLIGNFRDRLVCLACQTDLVPEQVKHHESTTAHQEALQKGLVVTSLKDEFIRQLDNGNYLCCHCNNLDEDWESMLEHLQTEEHKFVRAIANNGMQNYKLKAKQMSACWAHSPFINV